MIGHVGEGISAYLDGELEPAELSRVTQHLAGCETCRGDLESFALVRSRLRSLPMLELPEELAPSRKVEAGGRGFRIVWGAAAAVIAGLVTVASLNAPREVVEITTENLGAQYAARHSLDPGSTGRLLPLEALTLDSEG